MRLRVMMCTGLLAACNIGFAQTPPTPPDGGHHRGPPPEAIAACAGKTLQSACSFTNHKGDPETGTCEGPRRPPAGSTEAEPTTPPPLACRVPHPHEGTGG